MVHKLDAGNVKVSVPSFDNSSILPQHPAAVSGGALIEISAASHAFDPKTSPGLKRRFLALTTVRRHVKRKLLAEEAGLDNTKNTFSFSAMPPNCSLPTGSKSWGRMSADCRRLWISVTTGEHHRKASRLATASCAFTLWLGRCKCGRVCVLSKTGSQCN